MIWEKLDFVEREGVIEKLKIARMASIEVFHEYKLPKARGYLYPILLNFTVFGIVLIKCFMV